MADELDRMDSQYQRHQNRGKINIFIYILNFFL